MSTPVIGVPGVQVRGDAERRDILFGLPGEVKEAGGEIIDGSQARDPQNTGDVDTLRAGVLLGRITASGKYAPAILGVSTAALTTVATTLVVSAATALELVRRLGGSGTFNLTGPPSAAGIVVTEQVTYSAVDTTTGDITITATGTAFISGSFVQAEDGSEIIRSILKNLFGVRVTDDDRVDQDASVILLLAGQLDTDKIIDYPTDTSLKTFVKDALRAVGIGYTFKDDV